MKSLCRIFLSIFFILGFGCSNSSNKTEAIDKNPFKTFQINDSTRTASFVESIESINILRLEEASPIVNSPYVAIDKLGNKLVLGSFGKNELHIYERNGSLSKVFDQHGNNENKYSFMHVFWVEDNNKIVIHDSPKIQFKYYNSNGKHLKNKKISLSSVNNINKYKGHYFFDFNRRAPYLAPTHLFNIFVFDEDLNETNQLYDYEEAMKTSTFPFRRSNFYRSEEGLYYQQMLSDTLYKVSPNNISPILSLKFNTPWAWTEDFIKQGLTRPKVRNALSSDSLIYAINFFPSKDQLFFQYKKNRTLNSGLLNISSGTYKLFQNTMDFDYYVVPVFWEDDKLLCTIRSSDLDKLLIRLDKSKVQIEWLNNTPPNNNIVLLWVKFKRF